MAVNLAGVEIIPQHAPQKSRRCSTSERVHAYVKKEWRAASQLEARPPPRS